MSFAAVLSCCHDFILSCCHDFMLSCCHDFMLSCCHNCMSRDRVTVLLVFVCCRAEGLCLCVVGQKVLCLCVVG